MKIAGLDEVGRGAWAGPLCVAVVVLDSNQAYSYCDSKTLPASKREKLSKDVLRRASFIHIEMVQPQQVDAVGLGQAMRDAMACCIEAATPFADHVIIDGTVNYAKNYDVSSEAIIKADTHIPAVSAASIVSKVHRDAYMRILSTRYPAYGLSTNVGYGTKRHIDALREAGAEWFHRHSYKPIRRMHVPTSGRAISFSPHQS